MVLYHEWRGSSLIRHASLLAGIGLTAMSLVVLPGQWIPVLFRDDLSVIGLCLVILGVFTIIATASLARSGASGTLTAIAMCCGIALLLEGFATLLYKTLFEGIGWPEAHELGFAVIFVAACTLVGSVIGKLSRSWPRPLASITTATAVILIGSVGVWLFTNALPDRLETSYEAAEQVCEVRRGIEYCANPGYEPFVARWEDVVDAVVGAAPIDVDRSQMIIAQLLNTDGARVDGAMASPGLDWGKGAGEGVAGLGFGLDVANWVTGLETRLIAIDPGEPKAPCDPGSNARSVVAFWLAGQVGPEVEDVIGDLGCCADAINGSTFADPAVGGGWDTAEQLLALPTSEVQEKLESHWDELVDPDTPIDRVTEIFQLERLETTSQEGSDERIADCGSRYE